jgi:hypothetical protein
MREDYLDKLEQVLGRMTTEQVRQVLRFAQFVYEDQEPEGTESREDPAARFQEFSQWCQTCGIDPGALDRWVQDASSITAQTALGDET